MILGFKQKMPWKKEGEFVRTAFREKICAEYVRFEAGGNLMVLDVKAYNKLAAFEGRSLMTPKYWPKIHTMRLDPGNLWRPGRKIQMVYRGPKRAILDEFNKGIPELETCTGIQKVRLSWIYKNEYEETSLPTRTIKHTYHTQPEGTSHPDFFKKKQAFFEYVLRIWVDHRKLSDTEILTLARNDGFDTIEDFCRWFKKDFCGNIIHWTDFRY